MTAKPAFYEFFAGAGLVRSALDSWRCVWANDNDPRKEQVYTANFGEAEFHLADVNRVSLSSLPSGVDLAWSSFPCQDLSLAGWQRGMSGARSGTFWAFWRLMKEMHERGDRPNIIVIENVLGLLYQDNFRGLAEALAALNMQFGALVMDARYFLPQSRPRVFVVAVDAGLNTDGFVEMSPAAAKDSLWCTPQIFRAWRELPDDVARLWRWWRVAAPSEKPPDVARLIDESPQEVPWYSEGKVQDLLNMMSKANLGKIEAAKQLPGRTIGFLYKRTRKGRQRAEVRFDGCAGCLRTPGGGSSRQTVVMVEDGKVRARLLSPREAARLMGLSDSFKLPASYNDAYRAMGDGVAVPVARWLSRELLEPLASQCLEPASDSKASTSKYVSAAEQWAEQWIHWAPGAT